MNKRREIPKNSIQERLDEAGMSQAMLSRLTGIMPSVISSVVRGRIYPFRGYIEKICQALNCQPVDIIDGSACQEGSENKVGKSIANIYISTCTCTVPNNSISKCTVHNNINSKENSNIKCTDKNNKTCTGRGAGETNPRKKVYTQKEEYSSEFEAFWSFYPRKIEKKAAYEKWNATMRRGNKADDVIRGAQNYADKCLRKKTEENFMKHPKTFLGHNEYWREYLNSKIEEVEEIGQDYFCFEDKPAFSD